MSSKKQILTLENEAESLKQAGDFQGAIEKLQAVLAIDESFARAHLALAVLFEKVQNYEQSVAHAERAVELEPDDSFNISALSITYQKAFEGTRDPMYIHKAETALARSRRGCS
jgi:tetratricopeptide (TPR) repeat protein